MRASKSGGHGAAAIPRTWKAGLLARNKPSSSRLVGDGLHALLGVQHAALADGELRKRIRHLRRPGEVSVAGLHVDAARGRVGDVAAFDLDAGARRSRVR
ncbi:hypothetical protein G6F65_020340 [Rhizopus arrhizus]|nr:hypothetical protein G6F65_020340 [Rhizopus arrhizus]